MSVNKFQLIEEVRKRPLLWDSRTLPLRRNKNESAEQWAEIAKILNADEGECKHTWTSLRAQFRNEATRIPKRIAKAKSIQKYYPQEKYCRWRYFDALRFLVHGITDKATFHQNFNYISKRMEKIRKDQIQPQLCNSSTCQTESDVTLVECDSLNQIQTDSDHYKMDNNIEINLEQNLNHQKKYLEGNFLPMESNNRNSINPIGVHNESTSEPTSFKTYTVSIRSLIQGSECAIICNDNDVLQNDIVVKEEPELQIKEENDPVDSFFVAPDLLKPLNENQHEELEEFISNTAVENDLKIGHSSPTAFPKEYISSAADLNDEDYSFLYSFLSQTKSMTKLQKEKLHVNMNNLLVNISPAAVNILEKQLLLPDDNDPDRKYLISFLPFMKSMSLVENSKFRSKMADIVFQILSSEAIK